MIIAVVNNKGGVGKTTTVVHLAHALSRMGKRVLLVDMDGQANSLAHLFTEETVTAIRTRQNGHALPTTHHDATGVEILPLSFWKANAADYAHSITEYAKDFDVTLIDCPPSLETRTEAALTAADYVLIPTEPEKLSIDGIDNLLSILPKFNVQILGIVVTRYNKKRPAHNAWLQPLTKYYSRDLIRHYVVDSSVFPSACTNSQTAYEWSGKRRTAALEAYNAIAETMLKRAGMVEVQNG
jgi:chromosome partitioning protein